MSAGKSTAEDRELLEMAAKAHGSIEQTILPGDFFVFQELPRRNVWSPLTDDGDAFRLAVKLGLSLHTAPQSGGVLVYYGKYLEHSIVEHGELFSAIRRAIVRAAAALSKTRSTS